MTFRALVVAGILSLCSTAVSAQGGRPDIPLPNASSSDDIIVTALRIPRQKLPTAVYWDYGVALQSRIIQENARMYLRCALKFSASGSLRTVVDGEPNSAKARFAQGWIKETAQGCHPPSASMAGAHPNVPLTISDKGSSVLDRGVITELALNLYAPDAALTSSMTGDPAVQQRFRNREGMRNRFRFTADRDALVFASCLVREQPELSTRLFRSDPNSSLERGLIQTIIVEAKPCVGRAKRITVDPNLMRLYIIDAFYRWIVAARDVESLIPEEA